MTLGTLIDAQTALKRAYGLKIKDGRLVRRPGGRVMKISGNTNYKKGNTWQ